MTRVHAPQVPQPSPLPQPVEDVEFVVVARERVTPVIVELTLDPVEEVLAFVPGQYVLLGDIDYDVPVRSYSIANAPRADGRLTLLVTMVPGGETSTWAHDKLQVGDPVLVSGPYGTFVADPPATRPTLCLAGGSGLAPIRALAEDAVARGVPQPFTVFFSARTEADLIGRPRFVRWAEEHRNFCYLRTLTRETGDPPLGRIPGQVATRVGDLSDHEVFVAGDPGFVQDCARAARDLGVRPGLLHTEEFFSEPQPWASNATDREGNP